MKRFGGFTLVELLVAISIMAVLAVFGFNVYKGVLARARDSKRMDDLKKIQTALELYHNNNSHYPNTDWVDSHSGGFWIPGLDAKYIIKMPTDPKQSTTDCKSWEDDCYTYNYYSEGWCGLNGAGDGYFLAAKLESHSGSDLSQQTYCNCDNTTALYDPDATKCKPTNGSLGAGTNSLYTVRNP